MEISLDTIINVLSLLLGGGGGAFFVWRWQRKKAKAEASQAEASAAKELQDMYQQMIADAKADREDRRAQNDELRQERDHYKNERNEVREQVEKLTRNVTEWRRCADDERDSLRRTVARLGRKVDAMTPFMCGDLGCRLRQRVTISDDGEVKPKKQPKKSPTADIEPLGHSEI